MVALQDVLGRFHAWTEEYHHAPVSGLDPKLVHKHCEQNVLVSRIERVDADHLDHFIGLLALDSKHPFFFEHPLDHYPGLMLIEAGRQFGTAVAHMYYDVPFDTVFILNGVSVSFERFAELDRPVFVNSEMREKKYRHGRLCEMLYEGNFVQDSQTLGFMSGRWSLLDLRVVARMRRTSIRISA